MSDKMTHARQSKQLCLVLLSQEYAKYFVSLVFLANFAMQKTAKRMKDKLKQMTICEWSIIVMTIFAVALIVAGFCVPPIGKIDGSVLTAIGEMFAFGVMLLTLHAINKRMGAKLKHGNTTLSLNQDKDDDKD